MKMIVAWLVLSIHYNGQVVQQRYAVYDASKCVELATAAIIEASKYENKTYMFKATCVWNGMNM